MKRVRFRRELLFVSYLAMQCMLMSCEDNLNYPVEEPPVVVAEPKTVYEEMCEKIVSYYLQYPSEGDVEDILQKQLEDGAYGDINYQSIAKVYWEPLEHLERLLTLSCAYINPQSPKYGNEELYEHILKGLNYYFEKDPTKPDEHYNWYDKMIAEPHLYGKILLNMKCGKHSLPEELVACYCERWKQYGGTPAETTSANMTDVAMHRLYLAVLTENSEMLHESLHYVFEPVAYTSGKEGFQCDNSYTYHRRQFYIGGYSEVVLTNVLTVACWVAGTEFAIEEDKVELLSKFVRGTFADVIRGRVMFFNALGRSVSREDYLYKTEERTEFMRQMAVIDPQHAGDYVAIAARLKGEASASYGIIPKHSNYYIADYALHQRPGWSAGIRTVSERTVRQEVFAGNENLLGYFLSDGSTAIGTTGEEYGNIMPLWDWNHIPGVTAPVLTEIPIPSKYVNGTSSFTGGVSDGIYGVMTYSYQDTLAIVDTGAQKGWFALDEELVCLGSAINSPYQVHTTVDQNWGGTFEISTTGGRRNSSNGNGDDIAFVVHNDIGYYFPHGGHVYVENNRKHGSWYNINVNQSERMIEGEVFKLYLDHKIPNMEQDKWSREYCYVVCPGKNGGQMSTYVQNRQLFIHNTDSVQCVVDSDKDVAQFIFYEPCGFSHNGIDVKVSKPCVLMVRDYQKSNMRVYLADVLRDSVPFSVEVKTPNSDTQKIEVAFSWIDGYKGETKEYVLVNNRE